MLHVNPEHLIIGNGATELIVLINTTLIDRIAVPIPTFGEYIEKLKDQRDAELYRPESRRALRTPPARLSGLGAPARTQGAADHQSRKSHRPAYSARRDDRFPASGARIWSWSSSTNRSSILPGDPIPSLLPLPTAFSNLLIVRSMSKHCGVPGLRLGYCYSENLYVLNRLRRFIPTWNLNTLAQYFLSLLPPTDADYHEGRKRLIGDVRWLYDALQAIPGIDVYPTGANFVLFKIKSGMTAAELQGACCDEHQMYVRDCSNKVGMDHFHIRVASQGREKDARLVGALRRLLPMKRPAVLVVTRRTTRKNKYIDYVGEFHLELLIRLRTLPVMVPVVDGTLACLPQYMERHARPSAGGRRRHRTEALQGRAREF